MVPCLRSFLGLVLILPGLLAACRQAPAPAQSTPAVPAPSVDFDAIAARHDPYVPKQRVVVLTDIANEPDDQMSMVRFLVYSNQFDVEGLIATTSTWMRSKVRPDVLHRLLDRYADVHPTLSAHAPGFPDPAALKRLVAAGQVGFGMDAVGAGKMSAGAELILRAADANDPRPLWITIWGGANTLAQALLHARASREPAALATLLGRLRVYSISDQDDAGPWIRREFPALHYMAMPSTPDGDQYAYATWSGISGDRFYKNAPGADFSTFTKAWVDANVRAKGPLGKMYPYPCCIHEGDTPSFLGLIDNGLASAISPTYGGWGGRYVWRRFHGEPRPFWTQGGDAYPGRDSSRDTVIADGRTYTSDQATIWRWRTAFQHDFAARMDWTIQPPRDANHNPETIVVLPWLPASAGRRNTGKAPVLVEATVGQPIVLDASASKDPDGDTLTFAWFYYPEAGTGIPGRPVLEAGAPPIGGGGNQNEGGIPSAPDGPPEPAPRAIVQNGNTAIATVLPNAAGTAHVILVVEDNGAPSLTSYRRVVLRIRRR
jgi:hypothetical protein